jgi:hypothetical protein
MGYELKQTATGGFQVWDDASGSTNAVMQCLGGVVARGATNTAIVGTLPANAQIVSIFVSVPVVSNAATTATVSVGLSGGSNTYFSAAQDVKAAVGNFSQAATANWVASVGKQIVTVTYTETGTASTAGTAYYAINYIVN